MDTETPEYLAKILIDAEGLTTGSGTPSPVRLETLTTAMAAGASREVLVAIASAVRVSRTGTVVLPPHRLENMSRGKGWCRKGRGSSAVWGARVDGGYEVGPGRWTVGANDGYSRKGEREWIVKHVKVGDAMWTIAT